MSDSRRSQAGRVVGPRSWQRPVLRAGAVIALALLTACIDRELEGFDAGNDSAMPLLDSGAPSDAAEAGSDSAVPGPSLELGTGDLAFVPAAEGSTVAFHMGCQGGFHVFVSLRIRNMLPGDPKLPWNDPANPELNVTVAGPGGNALSTRAVHIAFTPAGEPDVYEVVGLIMFLTISACEQLAGADITVAAGVTDPAGAYATDTRHWVASDCFCDCGCP